jgi:uncharacterized protein
MSQTLNLYRLQQIDSQIDRNHTRLYEIQKYLDDDAELKDLQNQVDEAKKRNDIAEQNLCQIEIDVKNQIIKIDQIQSNLYAGNSRNPKELQDLQNDVAALKRHLITLEDRQIDAMQEAETTDDNYQTALRRLDERLKNRGGISKDLNIETGSLKTNLERLLVEREAITGAIPANELELYDQLRKQRRGVAVALIQENACGACGATLSLAQIQTSRSAEKMSLCPSCNRILYGS